MYRRQKVNVSINAISKIARIKLLKYNTNKIKKCDFENEGQGRGGEGGQKRDLRYWTGKYQNLQNTIHMLSLNNGISNILSFQMFDLEKFRSRSEKRRSISWSTTWAIMVFDGEYQPL